MSERYLFRSDWRASRGRVVLAGLLGHYAAAFCFCATLSLGAFLSDLSTEGATIFAGASWARAAEVAWAAPVVTALLGLYGAFIISPSLLITLPITGLAARKLYAGLLPTAVIGLVPGLLIGLAVFGVSPGIAVIMLVSSAAGGAAFASVVWLLCIRPRRP